MPKGLYLIILGFYKEVNMNKLVSVIIPNYNKEDYIKECIESVLRQTYANLEIIVVDDCSTDHSTEILNDYACINKLIKLILLNENKGVSHARNVGLNAATGQIITFLDSDDYYYNTNKLKNEIELIEKKQGQVLTYSRRVIVDKYSKVMYEDLEDRYYSGNILMKLLTEKNAYSFVQRDYCMPRKIAMEIGGYEEGNSYYEDYDVLLKLVSKYEMHYTRESGTAYRILVSGLSHCKKRKFSDQFLIPQKIRKSYFKQINGCNKVLVYCCYYIENVKIWAYLIIRRILIILKLKEEQ